MFIITHTINDFFNDIEEFSTSMLTLSAIRRQHFSLQMCSQERHSNKERSTMSKTTVTFIDFEVKLMIICLDIKCN